MVTFDFTSLARAQTKFPRAYFTCKKRREKKKARLYISFVRKKETSQCIFILLYIRKKLGSIEVTEAYHPPMQRTTLSVFDTHLFRFLRPNVFFFLPCSYCIYFCSCVLHRIFCHDTLYIFGLKEDISSMNPTMVISYLQVVSALIRLSGGSFWSIVR